MVSKVFVDPSTKVHILVNDNRTFETSSNVLSGLMNQILESHINDAVDDEVDDEELYMALQRIKLQQ
jgi:hypothetical protein